MAEDAENLATPGSANPISIALLGVVVPMGIGYYALRSWIHESCEFIGSGSDVDLTGDAAQAMAISYASIAVFCNARFFWGPLGRDLIYKSLTTIACLGFIGGLLSATVLALR